ncbi:MAG: hypothetical protein QM541_12525 [Flavobacterium sp.]|nr:hypothetical protein [Flavobacterium sp.]
MRKLLYLIILFLFCNCNQTDKKLETQDKPKESKYKNLLIRYKDLAIDTLEVYSSDDLESQAYKYKGTKLDTTEIRLFPRQISQEYLSADGYFACYKFSIDSNKIGLITRTPSTYASSSIKLLILDKTKDAITGIIELAETFGDAGDVAEKNSWIFNDSNKKFKCFIWVKESHDNSVDNVNDTTIEHWNNYYLINISKNKADTISTDEKILTKKFARLLKGYASR